MRLHGTLPQESHLVLAAVDVQVGPEDITALLGGKERDHRGDFLRAAHPAHCNACGEARLDSGCVLFAEKGP